MATIEGVNVRKLRLIPDERGWLMEIMRSDWEEFKAFGQVYVTVGYPNVVKAWHYHRLQIDHFCCIKGMMKVVLYDEREGSPTRGALAEFFIGELNPVLLEIPPLVYHGFKAVGGEPAFLVNVPDRLYDYQHPDEYRLPPETKEIPYDWGLTPGLPHG